MSSICPAALAREAEEDLRATFTTWRHHPSKEMWEALRDILRCMERMVQGVAAPKFYLSSVDPGVGKTQAVLAFLRALVRDPQYEHVGVLVAVSRLKEVEALAHEIGLPRDRVAVLTADDELNALGSGVVNTAQVLFTTQQRIEKSCRGKRFAETPAFFYRDHPRVVRVWDETLDPAHALCVPRDMLVSLLSHLRTEGVDLANALEDLHHLLRSAEDGAVFTMPDLNSMFGHDLRRVFDRRSRQWNEDEKSVAEDLMRLSRREVVIRDEPTVGPVLVSFIDHLPSDLAPLLILDASGRVRKSYTLWEQFRGGLARLTSAAKRYDDLVIHHWKRGGGKQAIAKHKDEIANAIAALIDGKPAEQWLVVHHKVGKGVPNLPKMIRRALSTDPTRLHFLPWGQHHAINAFAQVPNVVLAGTLFYRSSNYEALTRASGALEPSEHLSIQGRIAEVELGEHHHLVLQALCRGSVRRAQGDRCAPCHAYLIAAPATRIGQTLAEVFPGCRIEEWQPLVKQLRGKQSQAIEYLRSRFSVDPSAEVRFTEVRDAIGMAHSSQFSRIRQNRRFKQALEQMQVVECGGSDRMTVFRSVSDPTYQAASSERNDFHRR